MSEGEVEVLATIEGSELEMIQDNIKGLWDCHPKKGPSQAALANESSL